MGRKLTIELMQKIARSRGGKCLSKEYVSSYKKLRWRCKEGHTWEAKAVGIRNGAWCPICAHARIAQANRLTIEEMQEIARSRGGECLSKKYVSTYTKLKWRCKEGHVWEAMPNSVKSGSWCPICSFGKIGDALRLTIEEMRDTARARGGECLSSEYKGSLLKLRWRCREGHEWEATPNNIRSGHWCPVCGLITIANKNRLTIQEMQELARKRGGECLSKKYVDVNTKLRWRCKEGHEWRSKPAIVKGGSWCPRCHHIRMANANRLTVEEMQDIAMSRGGKCLSKEYVNCQTKLKWRCKEGHEWDAIPSSITRGHWCPVCRNTKRTLPLRLTIEDMQDMARKKGGECLSKRYSGQKTKLRWRCENGHVWKTAASNIKAGTWCPKCHYNKLLEAKQQTLERMRALAREKGGKCLSTKYLNKNEKLLWECKEGHRWETIPRYVRNGRWCPYCSRKKSGRRKKSVLSKEGAR